LGGYLAEMGLGNLLSLCIFIAFFFLLKWVLNISGEQLKSMQQERETWAEIQQGFNEEMKGIQSQIKTNILTNQAFFQTVNDAHKYQREEHKEIALTLGRINGYKDN
jgi:hypothetical protein